MSASLPAGVEAATAATTSDSLELRLFLPSGATIFHLGSKVLRRIVLTSISCRVDLASHSMALASGKHVSVAEQDLVDKITRRDEGSPMDAVRAIGRARERRGEAPVHKTAVYRYFKGSIHRRAKKERRGRPRLLNTADVKRLGWARRRLISEADNEWQVTHAGVAREAGYDGHACGRVLVRFSLPLAYTSVHFLTDL